MQKCRSFSRGNNEITKMYFSDLKTRKHRHISAALLTRTVWGGSWLNAAAV
uniref:Uncharacterized protein n=1 Tax=Arundo donax TaxID=35708 RepID=A0A0A9FQV7_ARUDO